MKNVKHSGRFIIRSLLSLVLLAALVYLGWNSALPDLFGLPPITAGQAAGLLALPVALSLLLRPHSGKFAGRNSPTCRRAYPGGTNE